MQLILVASDANVGQDNGAERGLARLAESMGNPNVRANAGAGAETDPTTETLRRWVSLMCLALSLLAPVLAIKFSGQPVLQRRSGLLVKPCGEALQGYLLFWPTHWSQALAPLLSWALMQWTVLSQTGDEASVQKLIELGGRQWQVMGKALKLYLPTGLNSSRVLTAA